MVQRGDPCYKKGRKPEKPMRGGQTVWGEDKAPICGIVKSAKRTGRIPVSMRFCTEKSANSRMEYSRTIFPCSMYIARSTKCSKYHVAGFMPLYTTESGNAREKRCYIFCNRPTDRTEEQGFHTDTFRKRKTSITPDSPRMDKQTDSRNTYHQYPYSEQTSTGNPWETSSQEFN